MIIRRAELGDVQGVAKVHVDSWRSTYKGIVPGDFLANLTYEDKEQVWKRGIVKDHVHVAEDTYGQIVGFAVGGKERTGAYKLYKGELYAIYILEEHQGKGVGKNLVQAVVNDLKEMNLHSMLIWAIEENPACRFYEAMGGRKIDSTTIEIGGKHLPEIAYGWKDISEY